MRWRWCMDVNALWKRWLNALVAVPKDEESALIPAWLLGIVLALIGVMFVLPDTGVDMLVTYGPAGRGEVFIEGVNPRNPHVALWLFWLLSRLPWKWDYLMVMLLAVPLLWFAVRRCGGQYWKVFLSFAFIWLIAYGQIDAFISLGLALAWDGLRRENNIEMGAGFSLLAFLKPQVGVLPGLYLWWLSPNKWKPLVIPGSLMAISVIQWGVNWPFSWLRATFSAAEGLEANWANASLYPWVGWWALLGWVPALFLPLDRDERLRAIMAAAALSMPYYPAYEYLLFLVFPTTIIEWALSNLPLLGLFTWGWIMPLWILGSYLWRWVKEHSVWDGAV